MPHNRGFRHLHVNTKGSHLKFGIFNGIIFIEKLKSMLDVTHF